MITFLCIYIYIYTKLNVWLMYNSISFLHRKMSLHTQAVTAT